MQIFNNEFFYSIFRNVEMTTPRSHLTLKNLKIQKYQAIPQEN